MSRVIDAFTQFFDGSGDPLISGWIEFLVSGTNDVKKDTYANSALSILNANPLRLDAEGRCPNVFGSGSYRVVLYEHDDATGDPGSQIASFDPVYAQYIGGDFDNWEESGVVFRPVVNRLGQLGDTSHLIEDAYFKDEGKVYLGDDQDFYIEYNDTDGEVNFVVDSTSKVFTFNSKVQIPDDIALEFGDSQEFSIEYDGTNDEVNFSTDSSQPFNFNNHIYLPDDIALKLGDSQDFYIEYDGTNDEVNFTVDNISKSFNFNSEIRLPDNIAIYFGDDQDTGLLYNSANSMLELDGNEIVTFEDSQFPGLSSAGTLQDSDIIILEDNSDSFAKKKTTLGELKTYVTT